MATVGCILLLGAAAATSTTGALVALALPLVVILCCLPHWWLPSIALVTFAVLPVGYLAAAPPLFGRFLTPTVVVLAVWLFRSRVAARAFPRRPIFNRWCALLALVLMVLVRLSLNPVRSLLWVAVFLGACVLPAIRGGRVDERTVPALLRTWLGMGAALSLVAMIESIARFNPLDRYYSIDQHWSVYRVTTLLGHPLMNGTFFAITGCLALFTALRPGRNRAFATVTFLLSSFAAALTASRSGVLALVVGLTAGLLILLWSRRVSLGPKLAGIGLGALVVVVVPNLPAFSARTGSAEAVASTLYRNDVVKLTYRLFVQRPLHGGGPGTSGMLADQAGASLPLESGILGSLVSLGVVGCLALTVFLLFLAAQAVRCRRLDAVAGLVAFLVAGAAFPLWESNPGAWALLGLLGLIAADRTSPTVTAVARQHSPAGRDIRPRVATPVAQ